MTENNFSDGFPGDAPDDVTDNSLEQKLPPTPSSPGKVNAYVLARSANAIGYDYSPPVVSFRAISEVSEPETALEEPETTVFERYDDRTEVIPAISTKD